MDNQNMNMGSLETKRSVGPVIGLVVIIAIILLGGVYFWMTRNGSTGYDSNSNNSNQTENYQGNNVAPTETVDTTVPSSYNSAEIDASLNNSNPSGLDTSSL